MGNIMSTPSTPAESMLSTHAKILINSWPALIKLIYHLNQDEASNTQTIQPIDLKQVSTALASPYAAWLKILLQSYSKLASYQLQCNIKKDKTLKEAMQKQNISPITLQYDQLNDDQIKKLSSSKLEKKTNELEQLVEQQYQAWNELYNHWATQLFNKLKQKGLKLTSSNEQEIHRLDLTHDVIQIANELQLKLDKKLYKPRDFSTYLQLKAVLSVHGSLAMQQQQADAKHIDKYIKQLKTLLGLIAKQQQEQLKINQRAIDEILTIN